MLVGRPLRLRLPHRRRLPDVDPRVCLEKSTPCP